MARAHSGTRCSRLVFILLAGIVHTNAPKSISFHLAPRASPGLTAVNTMNSKQSFVPTHTGEAVYGFAGLVFGVVVWVGVPLLVLSFLVTLNKLLDAGK